MTIETEFSRGDGVWLMEDNKPKEKIVEKVKTETFKSAKTNEWYVSVEYGFYISRTGSLDQSYWDFKNETECFATKKALLESL